MARKRSPSPEPLAPVTLEWLDHSIQRRLFVMATMGEEMPPDPDVLSALVELRDLRALAASLAKALEGTLRIADDDGISKVSLREGIEIMQRARSALAAWRRAQGKESAP